MSNLSQNIEDIQEQIYGTKDPFIGLPRKSAQEEVYTTWEKTFICVACISANFAVTYANSVYSPIEQEFTEYYHCNHKSYFWFLQTSCFTSIISLLPQAIFANRYPRYGMQLCILSLIIGPCIKILFPTSLVVAILGQVLISLGEIFSWVSTIEIASIIFNERQNQMFIGCLYVLPFLVNIFSVVFPPFVRSTLGFQQTIMTTHKLGVAISIFC